ncbi:MAG TPA: hypothetical protein VGS80_21535 [Ktedonobacterales bacterium]|nr:hypothetical protein [Ktedonobacterales bacterium]
MQTGPRHRQQQRQPITELEEMEEQVRQLAQQVQDLRAALEAADPASAHPLAALFVELEVLAECVVLLYHGVQLLAQAGSDPHADQGEGNQGVLTRRTTTTTSTTTPSTGRHRPLRKVTAEAAARREQALRHLPQTLLPSGTGRSALLALVRARYDVRVVRSRDGGWLVWLHVVAAARSDGKGYVTPKDWQTHWRQLVEVMGIAGAVAGVLGEEEVRRRRRV